MEYSKIISVTGLGGLYELIGKKGDGAIVRSLDDQTTKFVSNRVHNFSHLESIEVYTEQDNVNLVDVLHAMEQSSETLPDEKDAAAVKKYFEKVYPQMDFSRVYNSDMKKMIKWFSTLKKNGIEIKLSEEEPEENETEEAAVEETNEPVAEVKAEKKAETKKAETKAKAEKQKEEAEATEEKPKAKKAVVKKAPDSTSGVADVAEKKSKAKKAKSE